jgi:hypothetical protein
MALFASLNYFLKWVFLQCTVQIILRTDTVGQELIFHLLYTVQIIIRTDTVGQELIFHFPPPLHSQDHTQNWHGRLGAHFPPPLHCIKSELYLAKWKWILQSGPKLKMLVKFHHSNRSFPNPLNWWWIRFGCTALDQCYWNKENWFANWKSTMHFSDLHKLGSTMPLIIEFFIKIKSQFRRFWGLTRIIILSLP